MLRRSFKKEKTYLRSFCIYERRAQESETVLKSSQEGAQGRVYSNRIMKKEFHTLLDQMYEYAVIMDERDKQEKGNIQAEKAVGESWLVHHLRELKKLSKE